MTEAFPAGGITLKLSYELSLPSSVAQRTVTRPVRPSVFRT
jgi:hypothetical protein